jgi:hypothetical protein
MIVYKCRNCGAVLYEFKERDSTGLLSPREVAVMYNICPKCKAPLDPNISSNWKDRIIVKPAKKSKP